MTAEAALAGIAARQHGMVTWAQLRASGVSRRSVARHVTDGWLVRRHTGVYQLGVFPGAFGDEMAALLVCGPRAALSHWASVAVVERGAGRPGVAKLRAIVDYLDEPLFTRSEAERRLVELIRSAGLPMPRTNVRIARWEVDAVWDAQRLVVEVDGYRYHGTRATFERDRRKDADLMLAGYRVLRITWRRLVREREAVIALLATALRP